MASTAKYLRYAMLACICLAAFLFVKVLSPASLIFSKHLHQADTSIKHSSRQSNSTRSSATNTTQDSVQHQQNTANHQDATQHHQDTAKDGQNVVKHHQYPTKHHKDVSIGDTEDEYRIPADDVLKKMTDDQLLDVFTKYTNSMQILCRNIFRVGAIRDGGKEVCSDHKVCPRKPCLVYSVGSMNMFSFETAVISRFGCEVHVFDHSMGNIPINEIKVPLGAVFHHKGLAHVNNSTMSTLGTLLTEYGHADKTLDMFKIDIEDMEWNVLKEAMASDALKNVRQLLVEFHFYELPKQGKIDRLAVFNALYDYGFRTFSRDKNLGKAKFNPVLQYGVAFFIEMSFINIRYL